jgi:hypothetical protein
MAMTFLELVNGVVEETKVALDPLTSSNFADPPRTTMYNRFKRWINMGYKELFIDHPEWKFRIERGVFDIWPRVHIAGLIYAPSVGDVLVGQDSGVELTVYGIHSIGETGGYPDVTFDVLATNDNMSDLLIAEHFDLIVSGNSLTPPTLPFTNIGYLLSAGTYDFGDVNILIDDIQAESVRVLNLPEDAAAANLGYGDTYKVYPLNWDMWDYYSEYPWSGSRPQYMTQDPNGNYQFFPQPSTHQLITFNYLRTIGKLVNWDDIPNGIPDKYQDYLIWRAVREYADFDKQQALFVRATKHENQYMAWMQRDELPTVKFGPNLFYQRR